jgi:outer membrane protein OmpA-like peptidoglycan-associated protein
MRRVNGMACAVLCSPSKEIEREEEMKATRIMEPVAMMIGLALVLPACGPSVHHTRVATAAIVASKPKPKLKLKPMKAKIEIMDRVVFAKNRARLLPESFPVLDGVADILERNTQIRLVEIGGHTDSKGKAKRNRRLSRRRAAAVRSYLIQTGIQPDRLVIKGYGEENPVKDNTTRAGRKANRRVEFTILERGPTNQGG